MKIIYLNEARLRRQLKQSHGLVARMAIALRDGYAISPDLPLSEILGYDATLSNEKALERFITDQLCLLDEQLAQSVFQVLCDRLQRRLTRMPTHLQGGLL